MQDVVSVADRAVEDLMRARLAGAFPEDDLLGEEGGGAGRRAGAALWVIDPIDGTANFLRGIQYWSVALAYVKDDRVEIGVTYDPVGRGAPSGRGAAAARTATTRRSGSAGRPRRNTVSRLDLHLRVRISAISLSSRAFCAPDPITGGWLRPRS